MGGEGKGIEVRMEGRGEGRWGREPGGRGKRKNQERMESGGRWRRAGEEGRSRV